MNQRYANKSRIKTRKGFDIIQADSFLLSSSMWFKSTLLRVYIVSIDIAKRFHEATIINSGGNIVVKRIRFANSHAGLRANRR